MTSPVVPPRLAVGVVGTGRVGAVLGAALESAGHRVVAASAVSAASRSRAAALLPSSRLVPAHLVPADADLVLLTVPDDALPELVAGLAATGSLRPGQLVAHTSGRHGLAVLEPARRAGAVPLALHPVLPFSGTSADLHRLVGAAWGVTCSDAALPVAQALVLELGGLLERVPEERRPLWHAALAHAANHLTALVASSADLLREAGAERPDRVLAPLLDAALAGTLERGDAALTGPVARGDAGTVRAHLDVLAAVAPEVLPSYLAMARLTADRALGAGLLDPTRAGALLEVLGTAPAGGRS
ncbi:MAG TPA: DUF2520 domain-containing protein [Mycobacteriales bacterium]|nr:DUF2520 domain-containing protein [Mycobacteriales bacterium]